MSNAPIVAWAERPGAEGVDACATEKDPCALAWATDGVGDAVGRRMPPQRALEASARSDR